MQDQSTPNSTTTTDETERWLPIVGYESLYSVSSFGRVRNDTNRAGTYAGRIFSTRAKKHSGYVDVDLCRDGIVSTHRAHRLVMAAFVGPCPDGLMVNHIDGDKTNNHLSNLEYVTAKGNQQHARMMGLLATGDRHWSRRYPERYRRGEEHGNATLSNQDVADIQSALNDGEMGSVLARRYGVGQSTISRIKHGQDRFSV